MNILLVFHLTFFIILHLQAAEGSDSYLILIPHKWLITSEQTILTDLLDKEIYRSGRLVFRFVPRDHENVKLNFDYPIESTGLNVISFELPNTLRAGFYNISVECFSQENQLLFKNFTQDVELITDVFEIYASTDKPIYKAGETVHIRVVGFDTDLLPLENKTLSLYISDPLQNRVYQRSNLEFGKGIIDELSFKLTERPIFGQWQIKYQLHDETAEKVQTFEVQEYVLPRFDFDFNVQTYLVRKSPVIEGDIEAKYTFGKHVNGYIIFTIYSNSHYFYYRNMDIISRPGSDSIYVPNLEPMLNKKFELVNGKLKFSIPFELSQNVYSVYLNLTVVDSLSNENITKQVYLNIHDTEFVAFTESYFEENKENKIKLTLKYPNDRPYSLKSIKVKVSQMENYYNGQSKDVREINLKTDLYGLIEFNLTVLSNISSISLQISPIASPEQIYYLNIWKKYINSFVPDLSNKIDLELVNLESLEANANAKIRIKTKRSDPEYSCYDAKYFVIARSVITHSGIVKLCNDEVLLDIPLKNKNGPKSKLVVYYLNKNKNVSVGSLELNVPRYFANSLNLSFSHETLSTGEQASLLIKSQPNSIVSVCVIDQSVELLGKKMNHLDKSFVDEYLERLNLNPYYSESYINDFGIRDALWYPYYKVKSENLQELENNGFIVLNDLNSLMPVYRNYSYPMPMPIDEPAFFGQIDQLAEADSNKEADKKEEPNQKVRSNFKETWIWRTIETDSNGEFNISEILPDTITSWIASGFSMNSKSGLAIANKAKITTFKSFFVSIIMPPSVIRGEIVQIEAIVYNYLDTDLNEIRLTLDQTSDFLRANGNEASGFTFENITTDWVLSIDKISSQSAKAFRFFLKPLYIGTFSLTIRAQSGVSFDAERKSIKVKAEGISEFTSMSNLIDLRNTNNYNYNFEMRTPNVDVVSDSEHCSIQLVGDILGPAFNNLNNLLMKPYGCGEQTMLGLTPNIFALKYLLSSSQSNNLNTKAKVNSLINKAIDNILYGYQNELKYMHSDGSFSAFGNSDPSGSSWLTAFVVKSFIWAKRYITTSVIEDRIINKSIDWLISQQNDDGSFQEPGNVIHKDMQGGVNSKLTISAYITISLIEAEYEENEALRKIIDKGIGYLESQLKQSTLDVYSLTLITYALNLHNSNLAEFSFNQLKKYASNNIPGQLYWSTSSKDEPKRPLFTSDYQTPSADVEVTGYALLISILRNQSSDALSIAKWLISKSNSLGAYSSTQNTIIALQSLSEFSLSLKSRSNTFLNMDIEIVLDGAEASSRKQYTLNDDNSLVLQTIELPNCNSRISLNANGSGIAIFQAIMNYNLIKKQVPIDFYLKQEILIDDSKGKNNEILPIRTCVSYNQFDSDGNTLETGMAIVESGILAGYEIDISKVIESNRHIDNLKLVEMTKDNNLAFYFDNIKNQVTCIEWKLYKTYTVANIQAVPVRVYDYYKPQEEALILFDLKSGDPQTSRLVNSSTKLQYCIILYIFILFRMAVI